MTFFLIASMLSSRTEDFFIVALLGFILFLAARTIRNNAFERPMGAILLTFAFLILAVVAVVLMNYQLTSGSRVDFMQFYGQVQFPGLYQMQRGLSWLSNYREWASWMNDAGVPPTFAAYIAIDRAISLSYGIIAGIAFVVLQIAMICLLFIKTMPTKRAHRH
jgi:hypothetical protein